MQLRTHRLAYDVDARDHVEPSGAFVWQAIADEAHYLKSRDAQRSKLVLPLLSSARRTILLTGTPALNRPVELFTLLNTLCPRVPEFASYKIFTERYCGAHVKFFGRMRRLDVSGCTHADELVRASPTSSPVQACAVCVGMRL